MNQSIVTKQYKKWSFWKESPPSSQGSEHILCVRVHAHVCLHVQIPLQGQLIMTFLFNGKSLHCKKTKIIFLAGDPIVKLWLGHYYPQS